MNRIIQLSSNDLARGMHLFRARRHWPRDFHNQFYSQLLSILAVPLDPESWYELVGFLSGWRALRPFSRSHIYQAGLPLLPQLNQQLQDIDQLGVADFAAVAWSQLAPLFLTAMSIKQVTSPVFASKLCHFLRPLLYPVVDQAVIGIGSQTYSTYWQSCQTAWRQYPNHALLIEQLRQAIGETCIPMYPWATKIVELCAIGRSHNNGVE